MNPLCELYRRLAQQEQWTPDEERLMDEHLERCPECVRLFSEESRARPAARGAAVPTTASAPAEPPTVGTLLGGHFRLQQEIGRGGMGVVYLALDETLGRTVAIKVMHAHLAADPTARMRFRQEAQTAAGITHPHVVQIFHIGDDEPLFLVLEYIDGGSLGDRIPPEGMPARQVCTIGIEVAQGLEAVHAVAIHRDVKPSNILLRRDGTALLADFGLARFAAAPHTTQPGVVCGTPLYMAPEVRAGRDHTAASDLWSLGAVLHEMATGKQPDAGGRPRPVRQVDSRVPAPLAAVIDRLLQPDPADRYPDAAAAVKAIREARDALDSWFWFWVKCLLALLAAVLVAGVLLRDFIWVPVPIPHHVWLTMEAWKAKKDGRLDDAAKYSSECVRTYRRAAERAQDELKAGQVRIAKPGAVSGADKTAIDNNGLLNSVGTCAFILGEVSAASKRMDDAREAYELAKTFPLARCYSPDDRAYFSPAEVAGDRLLDLDEPRRPTKP